MREALLTGDTQTGVKFEEIRDTFDKSVRGLPVEHRVHVSRLSLDIDNIKRLKKTRTDTLNSFIKCDTAPRLRAPKTDHVVPILSTLDLEIPQAPTHGSVK